MTNVTVPVSIFNDVIGPVMRGPSSSHCAAALRIGRLARNIMDGCIRTVQVEYDVHGALATTHQSQGSDMGLFAGLMGWEATDERMPDSERFIRDAGVQIDVRIQDLHDAHPNTYHLTLSSDAQRHTVTAVSTGGGMIEVTEIDGVPISIAGDYFETLIDLWTDAGESLSRLAQTIEADYVLGHTTGDGCLIQVKAQRFLTKAEMASILEQQDIRYVKRLAPVLPILSRRGVSVPFSTCGEMQGHNPNGDAPLWALAIEYESSRGDLSPDEVIDRMVEIVRTLRSSVEQGLGGTTYDDRILGHQCGRFKEHMDAGSLAEAGLMNRIILYVTALMEVKSAMGVIVAAPTAGACGALPGACLATAETLERNEEDTAKALLAGGLVGAFIATASTFAAEVAGCQAECGAGSGMAAAALVTLLGGTADQALAAASMALQNSFGMTCDPVANRVEVPCLGKNVMAATNALACANMALAGYDPVVPLDEVIEAMDRVGRSLPRELRCTALGGLSVTRTSKAIDERLAGPNIPDSSEAS